MLQAAARTLEYGSRLTVISIFNLDQADAIRHLDCSIVQLGRSIEELERRERISGIIYSVLDQLRPDVLQSHHMYSDIYAIPAGQAAQIRTVRMVHGITQATKSSPLHRESIKTDWTDEEIRVELEMEDACSGTMVVSRDLRAKLLRYGFEANKLGVLYPGVDLHDPGRGSKEDREEGEAIQRSITIGYVGRIEMIKNPLVLPHVAREIAGMGYNPHFLIVGDGRQRGAFTESLTELDVGEHFTLLPLTTDMHSVYEKIDILVMPSISEGLPLVLLEAMALGIPVVATSVGGIPEVITDGVNGFLCHPDNVTCLSAKLARLIDSRDLRALVGSAGRETVTQRFSMDRHLSRLDKFYHLIVEGVPIGTLQDD